MFAHTKFKSTSLTKTSLRHIDITKHTLFVIHKHVL